MELSPPGISMKSIAMETNKILSADILDLIFDERNKEYGAYELRKTYGKRITIALTITGTIALLILAGSVLAGNMKTEERNYLGREVIILKDLPEEKTPEKPPEEKLPEPKPVKTEMFTTIKIVDTEVPDPPPTQEDLTIAKIDVFKQEGEDYKEVADPKPIDDGKGIIDPKKNAESDEPLTIVEVPAKFIGNWERFLRNNLNAQTPVDNDAPPGRYSVEIQFVVDKEGNVSDIKTLSNVGYGMEQEAVRVLKKATKWEPAIQNGYKAKAYHRQVITFEVPEE
jgi:periplasmic protein TonB